MQSTIINFVGIGFGAISRLIQPFVMSSSQIGILSFIDSINGVFAIIFSLGYNLIMKKIFPSYRDEDKGHHGFLVFGLLLSIVGIAIGLTIFFLLEEQIITNRSENQDIVRPFVYAIPVLIIFKILYLNIDGYARMLFKTVIGTFLDGLLTKVIFLLLIIALYLSALEFDSFILLYCIVLSAPGFLITLYAFKITKKITFPDRDIFKSENRLGSYILFGLLAGSSSSIIQYVDTFMIYKMLPNDATSYIGIYYLMMFAAVLISIPQRNINRISAVIISESWKENDIDNIQEIYQKSALNLLIIGSFLFIIGWACIDPVFEYLPEYRIGKFAFFFLGLAKVIELGTGVNMEIIEASSKYKYIAYFNLLLAVLVILFNFIFIQYYGIVGAAFATFLAMLIVNFFRAVLLKRAFNLWPFSAKLYLTVLIVAIFITVFSFLDYSAHPLLKIAINASLITLIYWLLVVKLNLSEDINGTFYRLKKRFFK
ncbi:MAG: polysaccharide biosynthesis C-terminal domain-containing protein [Crocinitomicaceae bacterium]|nr:polysaccharide biosynthesis C-terminal domain-containing protein [Crocinitomicaceae bacterium]